MTDDVDVVVIGGGPAGYAAAHAAAGAGARTVLVEAELLGGACVHHSCIPTAAQFDAVLTQFRAQQFAALGVVEIGDAVALGALRRHREGVVRTVAAQVEAGLRARLVDVRRTRAVLREPGVVALDSGETLAARAIVLATGSRWEVPEIAGASPGQVVTSDVALGLTEPPKTMAFLADGVAQTAFALEYATYFAALGVSVTLALPDGAPTVVPGLSADLDPLVRDGLDVVGIEIVDGYGRLSGSELIVAVDCRVPFVDPATLTALGVTAPHGGLDADLWGRTAAAEGVFAAGDVLGTAMTSAAATASGTVAGVNAAGGERALRGGSAPHVVPGLVEIAWAGRSPAGIPAERPVRVGVADLVHNPATVVAGMDAGAVQVLVDATTGEILGIHAVGPGAGAIVETGSALMQAEVTCDEIAEMVLWHPGAAESLVHAAAAARG